MGGSKPSPPTVVMPAPTAPTTYQSVTPLESYQMTAEQMKRIQQETGKIQEQRYLEVGTPAEVGARQAARRQIEAAAYLSAVPTADKYMAAAPDAVDPYAPVKLAAYEQLTEAQKEYAEALKKLKTKPTPTVSETPQWAKETVT